MTQKKGTPMEAVMEKDRLLVVDDEPQVLHAYQCALNGNQKHSNVVVALTGLRDELFSSKDTTQTQESFDIDSCSQGIDAVEKVRAAVAAGRPYAAVFLDINMPPGINGTETAKYIRALDPHCNIIMVTGSPISETETLAYEVPPSGQLFLFKKPFHGVEFRQLATALCGKWKSDLALRLNNERLEHSVKQRTAELFQMAYYDAATGLPNRGKLLDDLEHMLIASAIDNQKVAVVLFDIERFNSINETMGYEFGTQLLQEISNRLNQTLRDTDTAGRFGADSFACLVHHFDDDSFAKIIARIRAIFENPFRCDGRELHVNCSMGVAMYPDHGTQSGAVFRCAEAALHHSKRSVIHETILYESRMGAVALRRFELEAELHDAIDNSEIQPHFQPQIALDTGEVTGVEVLARWLKSDGSIVPPDSFIPVIEDAGLADRLFESMLRQTAPIVRLWQAQLGYTGSFSINVSAHQIRDKNLVQTIDAVLNEHGFSPEALKLELTETVLLTDFDNAKKWLATLTEFGVDVQLDDFGTGYSSLRYLADLPFKAVKIDRSFINRLAESGTQTRIVTAIIALGAALGVSVTAEGIETEEQMRLLSNSLCSTGQGYLIARPMPDAQFRTWFATRDIAGFECA